MSIHVEAQVRKMTAAWCIPEMMAAAWSSLRMLLVLSPTAYVVRGIPCPVRLGAAGRAGKAGGPCCAGFWLIEGEVEAHSGRTTPKKISELRKPTLWSQQLRAACQQNGAGSMSAHCRGLSWKAFAAH